MKTFKRYGTETRNSRKFREAILSMSLESALRYKVLASRRLGLRFKPMNTHLAAKNWEEVIYAFLKKGKIVYVGKTSKGFMDRMQGHKISLLLGAVDQVLILPIKKGTFIDYAEIHLIQKLRPKGNSKIVYGNGIKPTRWTNFLEED